VTTIELDPVDRITAGALGEPGERVFYVQGRKDDELVTILVEKQQVQLLAASVIEILTRTGKATGEGPPEDAMGLEEPLLPEWRAGRLAIGYEEERDLVLLEIEEVVPGEDDASEEGESEEAPEEVAPGLTLGPVVVVPTEESEEEEEEDEDDDEALALAEIAEGIDRPEPRRIRMWATREQMLSFARHGAAVCAAGRPRCRFCGNPIDPDGHVCPAMNGHHKTPQQ
jgi:uncharacterized repeat protein (TIGR03847 family)